MKCPECPTGQMKLKTARVPHEVRGVKFEVKGKALVCSDCGFQMIPGNLANKHAWLVQEGYHLEMERRLSVLIKSSLHFREKANHYSLCLYSYMLHTPGSAVLQKATKRMEKAELECKAADAELLALCEELK